VSRPRVYADFHNADAEGRLRLNCVGTTKDLARKQVVLRPGLLLTLYSDDADAGGNSDDLEVGGVVEYSEAEQCWVARVDWSAIRHASELRPDDEHADGPQVPVLQH
jgi:hypothetical protein